MTENQRIQIEETKRIITDLEENRRTTGKAYWDEPIRRARRKLDEMIRQATLP